MPENAAFQLYGGLTVDLSELESLAPEVKRALGRVNVQEGRIRVSARTDAARADLRRTERQVEALDRRVARPRVDVDTDHAYRGIEALQDRMRRLGRERVSVGGAGSMAAGTGAAAAFGGMGSMAGLITGALGAFSARAVLGATVTPAAQRRRMAATMERMYGPEGAQGFITQAKALQEQTGFLAEDFMRAAVAGRSLSANYGLQEQEVAKLIAISADFAATSPYEDIKSVTDAFLRLEAAARGEAESSERLGLTLNDTYMKNMAFNGALQGTWEKLDDATKASYRFREAIRQAAAIEGAASDETDKFGRNLRQAKADIAEAAASIGDKLLPVIAELLGLVAKIPTPVWEAGMAAAGVGAAVIGGKAVASVGRSLFGTVAAEATGEVAGQGLAGLGRRVFRRKGAKAMETVGREIVEEAAEATTHGATRTVIKGAGAKYALGGAVPKAATWAASSAPALAGGKAALGLGGSLLTAGALAAPVVATGGMLMWAAAKKMEGDRRLAESREETKLLERRAMDQVKHGVDYGVYLDEEGLLRQGTPLGQDQGAMEAVWGEKEGPEGQKVRYIKGYRRSQSVNLFSRPIGDINMRAADTSWLADLRAAQVSNWEAQRSQEGFSVGPLAAPAQEQVAVNTNITLVDRTQGGLSVQDAQSYSPSNQ